MATQAEKLVRIEGPTGKRVTVSEADYKHRKMAALRGQTYQEAGYNVVSYEDGTAYEDGSTPTEYALTNVAPEIGGEKNSGHTDIDGTKLTSDQLADAGIVSEAPAPRRARAQADNTSVHTDSVTAQAQA